MEDTNYVEENNSRQVIIVVVMVVVVVVVKLTKATLEHISMYFAKYIPWGICRRRFD